MGSDKDKVWRYVSKDGKVRHCRVSLTESAKSLKKEKHIFEKDPVVLFGGRVERATECYCRLFDR